MKKLINIFLPILIIFFIIIISCKKTDSNVSQDSEEIFKAFYSSEPIPSDIIWLTNDTDLEFASPEAKKGGTLNSFILSFPNTFRVVGPDSNNSLRGLILDNQLSLLEMHPNSENLIPSLATHWAFDKNKRTMYFKLDKNAKWSDGVSVTGHDYAYTIEFMRSKHIVAPWYNDYYTNFIEKVIVYDDYTISISLNKPLPELYLYLTLSPTPRHFYKQLNEEFITKYNWSIVPNTGPYQITKFNKGKFIIFERKKDWWAKDLKYFKNRFNADRVIFKVIKDNNIAWEYFKKGSIDVFGLTIPDYWYDKTKVKEFEYGYINKIWFFNDTPQSAMGMYLNQDKEIFKDKNVRYAFAHAMNVEKVIKTVLRDDYFRLENGYVGYGKYSNNKIRARRFDLDKVDNYMKKSGWNRGDDGIWIKNGLRFSVDVVYSQEEHTKRLVVLKEEAKKAGVELNLDRLDPATSYKKILEKKHDVAWMGWSTSSRPRFWEHYHSDNAHKPQTNNVTNNDDKELDILIDQYRNSIDENERIKLSLILQEKIYNIGDFVPTFMIPYVREAYWRWIKLPKKFGTKVTDNLFDPFNTSYGGLFWIDENIKKETLDALKSGIKFEPVTIVDETYKMDIIK
ncbi:MAG: ABC transporter substrate-binding protein [Spirochaetes bacterium]|nr:ABC transporter substrate-binding protein [Spirochaetota bacterium]